MSEVIDVPLIDLSGSPPKLKRSRDEKERKRLRKKHKRARRRRVKSNVCCENDSPVSCPLCLMTGDERRDDETRPADDGQTMIVMEHGYDKNAKRAFGHCVCPSCWGAMTARHANQRMQQGLEVVPPPQSGCWPRCPMCREEITGTTVVNCMPVYLIEGGGARDAVNMWESRTGMRQVGLRRQANKQ